MNEIKKGSTVPEPTLRRLPWYLAFLKMAAARGEIRISSTQISRAINVSAPQIAKDLSFLEISGKTRIGYDVQSLISVREEYLGFTKIRKAFLFGVGNLGAALLHDKGLSQFGLEILAGFDVNPRVVGTTIQGVPVYHIKDYPGIQAKIDASIGILTVPVREAQKVAEEIIQGGIRAIWNFTPFRIHVPEDIVVQNTSIYAHLAVMYNRMEAKL